MQIRRSDYVNQQVLKNLLTAQERSAEKGDSGSVIRLSRFLLRFFDKRDDEVINFSTEDQKRKSVRAMNNQKGTARPRGTDSAKVIQVIETKAMEGRGTPDDPTRIKTQYWDFDGTLLATAE